MTPSWWHQPALIFVQGLLYMESYFRSSFNIPQVDTRMWKYWSSHVLPLTLDKGLEGGTATHKGANL